MQSSSGYKAQFEEVYVSNYARMKRFAQQYLIHEEDAENIVHDIFSELWEKKMEFSSFVNFNGYLFMMLKTGVSISSVVKPLNNTLSPRCRMNTPIA